MQSKIMFLIIAIFLIYLLFSANGIQIIKNLITKATITIPTTTAKNQATTPIIRA